MSLESRAARFLALCSLAACALTSGCRALYTQRVELEPAARSAGLRAGSVAEVLRLPEEEIDLGRAALLVVREDRPDLDVDLHLGRLDEMAARLRRALSGKLPGGPSMREAALLIVRTVQPRGQRPVPTGLAGGEGAGIDLARILDGGRGNCLGLSVLYLAVAERVGLPLYGVEAPEHFLVRLDDGVTHLNIEPTLEGRVVPDEVYIRWRHIAREAIQNGVYLRSESKRQVLASLLANRAGYRALEGKLHGALLDAERALAVKPYLPLAHVNRGLVRELTGDVKGAEADYLRALLLDPHCAGALNNLASLFVKKGAPEQLDAAWGMISQALRLSPKRAEFHQTAASIARARGNERAVERHLRRASKLAEASRKGGSRGPPGVPAKP